MSTQVIEYFGENTLAGHADEHWTASRVFHLPNSKRRGLPMKGQEHPIIPALHVTRRRLIDRRRLLVRVEYA